MILSFSWTWPAFVAKAKTVTRRTWSVGYAARWRQGTRFAAYDQLPRVGGKLIGTGRLVADARLQPLEEMSDEDYFSEGFAWLKAHPEAMPNAAQAQCWADCTWAGFERWRNAGGEVWVVRYEIESVTAEAVDRLSELLKAGQRCAATHKEPK